MKNTSLHELLSVPVPENVLIQSLWFSVIKEQAEQLIWKSYCIF